MGGAGEQYSAGRVLLREVEETGVKVVVNRQQKRSGAFGPQAFLVRSAQVSNIEEESGRDEMEAGDPLCYVEDLD